MLLLVFGGVHYEAKECFMKKSCQFVILASIMVASSTVCAPKALAQEIVPITVPYEFTNLHASKTKLKMVCSISVGNTAWGQGETIEDISPPNATGSIIVPVSRTSLLYTVSQFLGQSSRSVRYECMPWWFDASRDEDSRWVKHFRERIEGTILRAGGTLRSGRLEVVNEAE